MTLIEVLRHGIQAEELARARRACAGMFLFFSNKLGCGVSLLISAVLTLIVLAVLGFF